MFLKSVMIIFAFQVPSLIDAPSSNGKIIIPISYTESCGADITITAGATQKQIGKIGLYPYSLSEREVTKYELSLDSLKRMQYLSWVDVKIEYDEKMYSSKCDVIIHGVEYKKN